MISPSPSSRSPRLRVARGPQRPNYMGNRDLDRFMMMFTALVGEVSALRDRLDTHELLAATGQIATPEAIEAFIVPEAHAARRAEIREAMLRRIFRVALEELEQAERGETTEEDADL